MGPTVGGEAGDPVGIRFQPVAVREFGPAATTLDGRHTLAYGTNTMVGRVEGFQLIQRLQNRVLSSEFCGRSRSSAATPALPGRL